MAQPGEVPLCAGVGVNFLAIDGISQTEGFESASNGALDATILPPVDAPSCTAGETTVGVAARLEAEIVAIGTGSTLGEPGVITFDAICDMFLVDD